MVSYKKSIVMKTTIKQLQSKTITNPMAFQILRKKKSVDYENVRSCDTS